MFRKIKILNIPAISFILRRSVTILLFRFSLFTAIFLIPEILEAQGHFLERYVILTDTVCRLDTALNILERSTGCYFSYNTDIIPIGDTVTLRAPGDTLSNILRQLIPDPDIKFRVVDEMIVLYKDTDSGQDYGFLTSGKKVQGTGSVRGRIIDRNSGDPVPFATISVEGTRLGTIANSDGDFIFKYPLTLSHDTIVISCMGFKMRKFSIDKMDSSFSKILLQPDYIPIQEVVIRKTDPVYLLHSAISKIPKNYFTGPVNLTTFYRESVKKGNRYIIISEAILEIFRSAFNDEIPFDQVRVVKGRKNVDVQRTDTVTLRLKAGLQSSLFLDIVRSRPDFLNESFFSLYTWGMSDIVMDENHYVYVITFKQHTNTQPPHYDGRIYIDMEALAIRAFEFNINPETIDEAAKYLVVHKPKDYDVEPVSAQYYVRYGEEAGKFYLSYILTDNVFRIRKKSQILSRTFETISEMAVTDTKTKGVTRFRQKETTDISDLFINQVGGYDEKFWGEYNYIQPDEPLEAALKRIGKLIGKEF